MTNRLFRLALTIIAIAAVGTLTWDFGFESRGQLGHDAILGLTVFAIGVVTFFGFLVLGHSLGGGWSLTKGGLRTAIAAAIVVTYLFMVSFEIFLVPPSLVSPITEAFVQSFTGIVGVTIAFYFGASAALQALGKDETSEKESTPKKEIESKGSAPVE
jgi:hypothetical protein